MKRFFYALVQIAIVLWAGFTVFKHDLRNVSEITPFLAAIVLRGWMSKEINDPLFGREAAGSWILNHIKKLAPKGQPKERWDI